MIKFGYMDFIINMQKNYACDCVVRTNCSYGSQMWAPYLHNSALNC